ncbi:MAG: hypothetical protein ACKVU1_15845 [bacterium]
MADDTAKPTLLRLAELFDRHDVEFIVIGGQAAVLLGSPLATLDVDLCYRRTNENLVCLASALTELHPQLRGAPPDLRFTLDARSLALGANFRLETDLGPLDLLSWVEPIGTFDDLIDRCERIAVGEQTLNVISLADLIRIKRHLGRPKDVASLAQLEAIQRIRGGRTES